MLKDRYEAEDVVQDAFLLAFEKISQLQEAAKLKHWLVSIVINQCRKRTRRWSFKNILLRRSEDIFEDGIVEETPESELLRLIEGQSLSVEIRALDFKYREVIALFYFQQLSVKEISDITKENESTIKSRLSRGRKQLKERLKGERSE
ncbi:RNA polymerase sigma factor [Halalkalibacter akibai]|uniref:RNA polymerase ECF-type sigma factor n=1 Tax=Halalkalibacter akibai (strain ATCC 43226 / DSM 21942 / CIP 109018 / JCM 9157 / 1139) TaxID=1236973 RepID=W4QSS8_HALA3|nr:sigma-70 family RNA polymerase sigma factor [Halalkalibacter akibai]GAE34937.1 RNA polymerase ECF-type sigma factor [Halalkalibacter akibai JCM 9157]